MPVCGKCHRDAPERALFCSYCGESIKPITATGQEVDPLIGQTLGGKYFIQQLLGHGGMGDVYKATHLTLDRPVVLKLLKKLFHSDQSLVQRFHREARAASRLNHPNSITVIDFGQTDDGTLFMAMEYLAGRSLDRVIVDQGPVPERRVIHIGAQILAALGEAHALGIIHRDLKPANVMIEARRDEPDFVKVLDFGIAKLNEPGGGGPGLTQAGIVCGTPGYMSTEQVRGDELDARSDIYAVGVILYEMLTGVLPFESETPMGLVTKHLVEDPPPLAVRRPGLVVSPALEALIMRALARDRRDRFASADDMRAALLACAASAAPSVRPTPAPSSTVIFDPGVLPTPPPARPVTGASAASGATPSGSAISASAAQPLPGGATAVFPSVFDEPGQASGAAPPGTPVPGQRTPAPAHGTPAAVATPAPVQATTPARKTPAPPRKTPSPPRKTPSTPRPAVSREVSEDEAPRARAGGKAPLFIGGGLAAVLVIGGAAFFMTRGGPEPPAACTSFTYSGWSPCEKGTQTRAVLTSSPAGCTGGSPDLSQACALAPTPPICTSFAYSGWSACEKGTQTRTVVTSSPAGCTAGAPALSQPCTSPVVTADVPACPKGIKGSIGKDLNSIATPPASSCDGVLTLVATPWAMVSIEGRDLGETPREVRLGAGTYRVRASHPALGERAGTVTIKAGKRQTWSATFAK